jgi:hypothetical protein
MATGGVCWLCKERSRQVVAPTYLAQGLNIKVKYEILDEFAFQQGPRKVLGRCESYKGKGGIHRQQ